MPISYCVSAKNSFSKSTNPIIIFITIPIIKILMCGVASLIYNYQSCHSPFTLIAGGYVSDGAGSGHGYGQVATSAYVGDVASLRYADRIPRMPFSEVRPSSPHGLQRPASRGRASFFGEAEVRSPSPDMQRYGILRQTLRGHLSFGRHVEAIHTSLDM
jgi:hypothetical protein